MCRRGPLVVLLLALPLVSLSFVLTTCSSGSSGSGIGPISGDRAMAHVRAMVGLGARPAGSPMLLANRDQIRKHLVSLGLKVKQQDWWEFDSVQKKRIKMHNIWTEIPGQDPTSGPILILCAHYDTKLCTGHADSARNFSFKGAIDGAGASSVLMELCRHLKDRQNGPNIWILWVDGEESIPWEWKSDNTECLHGSRHFVAEMAKDRKLFRRIKALVLLDLIGSKNQKIDKDKNSSAALNAIFLAAAESIGMADRMYAHSSSMTDDHIPFQQQGIAVIDLIDFHFRVPGPSYPKDPDYEQWWHTDQDDLEAMDPASLAFAGNLVWAALPILDAKFFKMAPATAKQK